MDKLPPVLILAGGFGTRIRDHFPDTPKYLIPINGEPFALHQLRLLKRMGFSEIILCVGHKKESIQKLIGDGSQLGLNIRYSEDDEKSAGTGGAIKKASRLVSSPFCVLYGDSYLEFNFQPVYEAFINSKKKALMIIYHNRNELGKSNVSIKDGNIIKFNKENQENNMEYIDYGFSLFSSDVFHSFNKQTFDLSEVTKKLISENELAAFEVHERFYEVGSLKGINELQNYFDKKLVKNQKESLCRVENEIEHCKVCCSDKFINYFLLKNTYVAKCTQCGFIFLNPQPNDQKLSEIYNKNYFLKDERETISSDTKLKKLTADLYLSEINRYCQGKKGKILEIGCGEGNFLTAAESDGWDVEGVDISPSACEIAQNNLKNGKIKCGEIADLHLNLNQYDVCVLSDVIEHVRNPNVFLKIIHNILNKNGVMFITTPSTDSFTARIMRKHWMEYKLEHLSYFNFETIQTILFKADYRKIEVKKGWKILSYDYIKRHFERYPVRFYTHLLNSFTYFIPRKIQTKPFKVVASGMMILAQKIQSRDIKVLSIIIPVYNEIKTVDIVLKNLLSKKIRGIEFEIIIVESASTDGTHELIEQYNKNPRIKIIFEKNSLGKGRAVRTGLEIATGDYILIQDADLEYDINDYEPLLKPIIEGRRAFVLGSRHKNRNIFKMRQFHKKPIQSLILNLGHCLFTTLINLLYFQKLYDPFTMYKVFRRDCLHDLTFQSDRFEFDIELLIKLIKKGYKPLEIPVAYQSRSFKEGKKIKLFQDSFLSLKAIFKYRFKN